MFRFFGIRECDYIVKIKTGDRLFAGTDGIVWLKIYDEFMKSTNPIRLAPFENRNFAQGSTYTYQISIVESLNINWLGLVEMLEFWRDGNALSGHDWFVDTIHIRNKVTKTNYLFPVYRWIRANVHYKIRPLDTSLPQYEHDELKKSRELFLQEKRNSYILAQKFPKEFPNGPVQVKTLPKDEQFSRNNQFTLSTLTAQLRLPIHIVNFTPGKWKSIGDILTIFADPSFPIPEKSMWMTDEYFAEQRVAGINNSVIRLMTRLPEKMFVGDARMKEFLGGLTIQEAMEQKRLFICDLKILDGLPVKENRVLCAPIALFFLDISKVLRPVAIRLFQKPGPDNPIFTPKCPTLTWTLVKMWYNNADSAYHQGLTNLGFTHLLMESFCLATNRNLHISHPVFKVLAPHFLNLLAINSLAVSELLKDGGWVDSIMNYGNKGMFALIEKGLKGWRLDVDGTLPEDLRRRGGSLDDLPCYHFGEDAKLLYGAIKRYVENYLNLYYTSPKDVLDDHEIQSWAQELVKEKSEGGFGIKGIPGNGRLTTVEQIQQIVTSIIYKCSVGHAAANSGQYDEYSYPPNYPLAMYGKPPTDPKVEMTEQDILNCLPDKETTVEIMAVTKILSSRVTKSLGDFEVQYIVDPKANPILDRFRKDLHAIHLTIRSKNVKRFPKYRYLNPTLIQNNIGI
ncbi:hypothetical protein Btru_044809 [Bulinus truncatus]|nr:hypothetical protein Btru_044809 [Bulinus truncatus]